MDPSRTLPVVQSMEHVPQIFLPLIREVPPEVVRRRPSPGKWSAHEHACHLAAVQPMFFERLELMLKHDTPTIEPYLPSSADEEGGMLALDLEKELVRFEEDRKKLVALLKGLNETDWDRTAVHGEYNQYSVFILFRHVVLHDMLHAYRIEELLLRKEW